MSVLDLTRETLEDVISANSEIFADQDRCGRLIEDFNLGRFYGLVAYDSDNRLTSYLIYYYSYSTWENRVIYVSEIWLGRVHDSAKNVWVKMF